jgi:hypothetical protein
LGKLESTKYKRIAVAVAVAVATHYTTTDVFTGNIVVISWGKGGKKKSSKISRHQVLDEA